MEAKNELAGIAPLSKVLSTAAAQLVKEEKVMNRRLLQKDNRNPKVDLTAVTLHQMMLLILANLFY